MVQQPPSNAYFRPALAGRNLCFSGTGGLAVVGRIAPRAKFTILSTLREQSVGQHIEANHANGVTTFNRCLGHAVNHARLLVLRNGHAAGLLDETETMGSVLTHTGHEDCDRLLAEFFGNAFEK